MGNEYNSIWGWGGLLLSADLGLHDGGESDDARSSNLKENKKKNFRALKPDRKKMTMRKCQQEI